MKGEIMDKDQDESSNEGADVFLDSILDALSEHIAILDENGEIIKVNQAWCGFTDSEGLDWDDYGIGRNYIETAQQAEGLYSEEGPKAAEGLKSLLNKETDQFTIEYPCHSDKKERWFYMDATRFEYSGATYIVVSHKNITERKVSEQEELFLLTLLRHDLKNKTQIVRGYLQLLLDSDLSEEDREMVEKTLKASMEGQELLDKVGKLKDIDRVEELGSESIKSHVKKVIEGIGDRIDESDLEVEMHDLDKTVIAGSLLEELFSNIIENSLEHSEGDMIRISTEESEDKITTVIEDDGKGVSEESKNKLFERGFRGGTSSGLGIGLYLVKKIVEKYDGEIEVKDSELGGARFDIILKKA